MSSTTEQTDGSREPTEKAARPKIISKEFILAITISFCAFACSTALINGTPLYIVRLGGMTSYAGMLILVYSLCAGVMRLLAGRIIDSMGRKRIIVVGAILLFAGTVLAVPFPGIEPQVILRAMQGIGFACVTTGVSTVAADVLPLERVGEGIGYFSLGHSLGMALGPAFAIFLCSMMFPESLFVGVSAIGAAAIILALCCNYEKHVDRLPETSGYRVLVTRRREEAEARANGVDTPQEEREVEESQYRGLAKFFEVRAFPGAVPMMLICLVYAIPMSYTALYAESIGLANAGIFFVIAAIVMTFVRLVGGKLLDIVPPRILFFFCAVCSVIQMLLYAYAANEFMLYAAGVFHGFSMGYSFPLLNSMCIKSTPAERWGAANGLYFLANDLGIGFGAVIWGAVVDAVGFAPVFTGGIVTSIVAFVVAFLIFPRVKRPRPESE